MGKGDLLSNILIEPSTLKTDEYCRRTGSMLCCQRLINKKGQAPAGWTGLERSYYPWLFARLEKWVTLQPVPAFGLQLQMSNLVKLCYIRKMPFEIQRATVEDIPAIVALFDEAFADDRIVSYLFKDVPKETIWERDVKWHTTAFENSENKGTRYFKAVETSNREIAGISKFDFSHPMTDAQKAERAKGIDLGPWPDGANLPLCEDFFGQLDRVQQQWVDPEKDTYLSLLAVRPQYHRLGLGSRLIKAGLDEADAIASKVYVIASPMGLPVYMKHGCTKIDEVVMDMRRYGGSDIVVQEALVRELRAEP